MVWQSHSRNYNNRAQEASGRFERKNLGQGREIVMFVISVALDIYGKIPLTAKLQAYSNGPTIALNILGFKSLPVLKSSNVSHYLN